MQHFTHLAPLAPALIDEVTALSEHVFSSPAIDYAWRLANMPDVSLFCARSDGQLIGFKAGYAVAERRYYSWLGAVHPDHRRQGVATELARLQHAWIAERNYTMIETSSRGDNAPMANLNLANGFSAIGTKLEAHGLQVLWAKKIA